MQKIDFVKNLEVIVERLKSKEILDHFQKGFLNPSKGYQYNQINPLLFLSKSNYDYIKADIKYSEILKSLNGDAVYSEQNLSILTVVLQQNSANQIIQNQNTLAFFNFHNSLVSTLELVKNVLISDSLNLSLDNSLNNGVVIFQILIQGEGLETEKYIKIFSALQQLIETISKILGEANQESEIVLLDSGSDTNIGIKSGIETAKSLFLIFKEVWDFITSFKFYKQGQKNKALVESLSIRAEILKRVEEKVISEEEGREYIHMIKTRTDDLIGMKVLPKQIVIETNLIENKKMLLEFEGLKMLASGNE